MKNDVISAESSGQFENMLQKCFTWSLAFRRSCDVLIASSSSCLNCLRKGKRKNRKRDKKRDRERERKSGRVEVEDQRNKEKEEETVSWREREKRTQQN